MYRSQNTTSFATRQLPWQSKPYAPSHDTPNKNYTSVLSCQVENHTGFHQLPVKQDTSLAFTHSRCLSGRQLTHHTGTHLQLLFLIGCHVKHRRHSLAAAVRMALRARCIIALHDLLHLRLSSAAARVATIGAVCGVMTCTASPVKTVLPLQLES